MKLNRMGKSLSCFCAAGVLAMVNAYALPFTISSPDRTATLDSATAGVGHPPPADSNLDEASVNTAFPTMAPWTRVGQLTGIGTAGLLTITLTSGAFGGNNVAGTWAISSSFWSTYSDAVIGLHVGNGQGDPDVFMFLISQGATSGTFSYQDLDGMGGGLSNMQLFGSGTGTVPDGGSSLVMIGLALTGLGATRRFIKKA